VSKIIINTSALYAEIPTGYDTISINLVAVRNNDMADIRTRELINSVKASLTSRNDSECWGTGIDERSTYNKSERFEILYEVEILWEIWEKTQQKSNSYSINDSVRRNGRLRTHAMTLEQAQLEKRMITKQLLDRHQITNVFDGFLGDPDSIAVGLLSDLDWEREAARIVSDWLDKQDNSKQEA